jgi:hypothetical protein
MVSELIHSDHPPKYPCTKPNSDGCEGECLEKTQVQQWKELRPEKNL